jgi:hypothetical protein
MTNRCPRCGDQFGAFHTKRSCDRRSQALAREIDYLLPDVAAAMARRHPGFGIRHGGGWTWIVCAFCGESPTGDESQFHGMNCDQAPGQS